jgi:DNA-binding XRE family transcriptional regulator
MSQSVSDVRSRVWNKVEKQDSDECWEWTGATDSCGYGNLKISGSVKKTHRVALALDKGQLSLLNEFDIVRHKCDNPSCVNPSHLTEGTQKDNMIDMSERERASNQKLDTDDAREIKERYREEDVTYSELAEEFGVYKGSIAAIMNGHSFKHVD